MTLQLFEWESVCIRQTLKICLKKIVSIDVIGFPLFICAKLQASKEKEAMLLVSKQCGVSNAFLKLSASSQRYLMHFVTF